MTNLKNMSKRGLALFLALVMCLGMMNLTAFAAEDAYVCGLEEHTHTDACYQTQSTAPSPVEGHSHTDGCYSSVCSLEESEGHSHTDACYEIETFTEKVLDCGLAEAEAHTHTDACYTTPASQELVCTLAEGEGGHEHSDSCFTTETITKYRTETYEEEETYTYEEEISVPVEKTEYYEVTDEEGNTSTESRTYTEYETHTVTKEETRTVTKEREVEDGTEEITTLTCGMEPGEGGHVHSESCYETVYGEPSLSCGLTEVSEADAHTHTDACWREDLKERKVLTCALEDSAGHTHGDGSCVYELVCGLEECADVQPAETVTVSSEPTCGKAEHVHTVECLAVYAGLTQGLDTLGTAFGAFQEEFSDSWTGGYDDSFQTAFASAAAAQFGEDFNALLTLYKQIPARHFGDEGYAELTDALEMFATAMGGDLNSGINLLADDTLICDETTIYPNQDWTVGDGDHIVTVTGTWKGTITYNGTGTMTITGGGTIDATGRNKSAITVTNGATVKLVNATITGGTGTPVSKATPWADILRQDNETAGGGVLVKAGGTFKMEGGTIINNSAHWGGGIAVEGAAGATKAGQLTITAGTITDNNATGTSDNKNVGGGGGIFCSGNATLDPSKDNIFITNNVTTTTSDLGGGGIFVESSGSMNIMNAVITGNTAYSLGGGVAGCLHSKVAQGLSPNTAEIRDNTSKNQVTDGLKNVVDHDSPKLDWNGNLTASAKDYFCAGYSLVGAQALTGTTEWKGNAVYRDKSTSEVSTAPGKNPIIVRGLCALTASYTPDSGLKRTNTVNITGNTSHMHGGGIGCNGILTFGGTAFTTTDSSFNLTATKTVSDSTGATLSPAGYTFKLCRSADGSGLIAETKSLADGSINFNDVSTVGLFTDGKATLYLIEEKGHTVGMNYDTVARKIELSAKTSSKTETISTGNDNNITVTTYTDTVTSATVDGLVAVVENGTLTFPEKANFINTMEYGKLTVTKKVSNSEVANADDTFTFDVTLGSVKQLVTLKAGESWTSDDFPVGTQYTVIETSKNTNGYSYVSGEVTSSDNKTIEADGNNVTVTNKRDLTDLTVTKTVDCNHDTSYAPDSTQGFTIKVKLGSGGADTSNSGTGLEHTYVENGEYTFILKDGDSAKITGIPIGTSYAVTEETLGSEWTQTFPSDNNSGTLNTETTVAVRNHYYSPKLTNVDVQKFWDSSWKLDETLNGFNPTAPTIKVNLLKDGEVYKSAELTMENGWYYDSEDWKNLPVYASEDAETPIQYSVEETEIVYPEGYTCEEEIDGLFILRGSTEAEEGGKEILGAWSPSITPVSAENPKVNNEPSSTELTMKNTWIPAEFIGTASLKVVKTDSKNSQPIQGVTFTLVPKDDTNQDVEFTREAVTDENGIAVFNGLPTGEFTLTESAVPDPYKAPGNVGREWTVTFGRDASEKDVLKKVEVNSTDNKSFAGTNHWEWKATVENGNEVGLITITNVPVEGSISITKLVTGTDELRDKEFTFRVTGNGVEQEVTVKAGETETISNLRYGTYTITETGGTGVEGFQYNGVTYSGDGSSTGNSWQVNVTSHGTVYAVTADNSYTELGGLSLTKNVTGGDGNRSRDWNFVLTLEGNTIRTAPVFEFSGTQSGDAKYVRNEDGTYTVTMKHGVTLQVTNLSVGTRYSVYEVEANQNGYTTSATKDDVTVPYVDGALTVSGTVAKDEANNVVFTNHNPSTPDNPRTPETPDEPEDPVEPERPEEPTEPETPIEPEIPDEPVPMEDMDLFDDDVPLSSMPEEEETFDEEEILDEEVPLLDVSPETGDHSRTSLWAGLCALSLLGIAALLRKKRDP